MDKKNGQQLLRQLPKVDDLLLEINPKNGTQKLTVEEVRDCIDQVRQEILAGTRVEMPTNDWFVSTIEQALHQKQQPHLRSIVNGTGIILHTNLGRAKLSEKAAEAVYHVARRYSNLEYDLAQAKRGSRYSHIEDILAEITGAEAAMAVNNNAAAVMLVLGTLCKDREVVLSRGELVEIGGSFRVPEIMEQSNSTLVEVGTTNKTHYRDYEKAINENTSALLKVHTSNFKITGFTQDVSVKEMAELAHKHGLPMIHDIGSGSFIDLKQFGILDEPTVMESLADGADVVSFSGDKLLGGPQAGIIVGKKAYIEAMKKHPLTRAIRIDKLTLAALEATLKEYLDEKNALETIPTYAMLSRSLPQLKDEAQKLKRAILRGAENLQVEVVQEQGQIGGGSVPTQMIDSYAVAISSDTVSVNHIEEVVRLLDYPIIGRIAKDRFLLDLRTIDGADYRYIGEAIRSAVRG